MYTFNTKHNEDLDIDAQCITLLFMTFQKRKQLFSEQQSHKFTQSHYTVETIITYFDACRNYCVIHLFPLNIHFLFFCFIFNYTPIKQRQKFNFILHYIYHFYQL